MDHAVNYGLCYGTTVPIQFDQLRGPNRYDRKLMRNQMTSPGSV